MERYGLSFVEADRWTRYLRAAWQTYEADFLAGQSGQLSERLAITLTFPDQALFWQTEQYYFDQRFVDYVNSSVPDYEFVLDDGK
jgi:hypothetical protein